ncbi:hypothetical protein ACUXIR_000189 [Staphylococcus hominis]
MKKTLMILNLIAIIGLIVVIITVLSDISILHKFLIYSTTFFILLIDTLIYYFHTKEN